MASYMKAYGTASAKPQQYQVQTLTKNFAELQKVKKNANTS